MNKIQNQRGNDLIKTDFKLMKLKLSYLGIPQKTLKDIVIRVVLEKFLISKFLNFLRNWEMRWDLNPLRNDFAISQNFSFSWEMDFHFSKKPEKSREIWEAIWEINWAAHEKFLNSQISNLIEKWKNYCDIHTSADFYPLNKLCTT